MKTLDPRPLLLALLLCAGGGCSNGTPEATDGSAVVETAETDPSASACPGGGARLPGTGLCPDQAADLLLDDGGASLTVPDGCEWAINETEMPEGEYLLYRAARCGGQTARLEFAGGARTAELRLSPSVISGEPMEMESPLVRIMDLDPDAPTAGILAVVSEDLQASGIDDECAVRKADVPGWPTDALVADIRPEVAAAASADGPRANCGQFGYNEDEARYWRVFQGQTWFFQLDQDLYQDIDPNSLTLVVRDRAGEWQRAS